MRLICSLKRAHVHNINSAQRQHPDVSIALRNRIQFLLTFPNSPIALQIRKGVKRILSELLCAPCLPDIATPLTPPLSLSFYPSISLMTSLCTFELLIICRLDFFLFRCAFLPAINRSQTQLLFPPIDLTVCQVWRIYLYLSSVALTLPYMPAMQRVERFCNTCWPNFVTSFIRNTEE